MQGTKMLKTEGTYPGLSTGTRYTGGPELVGRLFSDSGRL